MLNRYAKYRRKQIANLKIAQSILGKCILRNAKFIEITHNLWFYSHGTI